MTQTQVAAKPRPPFKGRCRIGVKLSQSGGERTRIKRSTRGVDARQCDRLHKKMRRHRHHPRVGVRCIRISGGAQRNAGAIGVTD